MTVYIDTSAFFATIDADDENHQQASVIWSDLIKRKEPIVCNTYTLLETLALLQNRLGLDAVRDFQQDIYPRLLIDWTDDQLHREAVNVLLIARRRQLSLVDCASFVSMRRLGIQRAFAFDRHFSDQGFEMLS